MSPTWSLEHLQHSLCCLWDFTPPTPLSLSPSLPPHSHNFKPCLVLLTPCRSPQMFPWRIRQWASEIGCRFGRRCKGNRLTVSCPNISDTWNWHEPKAPAAFFPLPLTDIDRRLWFGLFTWQPDPQPWLWQESVTVCSHPMLDWTVNSRPQAQYTDSASAWSEAWILECDVTCMTERRSAWNHVYESVFSTHWLLLVEPSLLLFHSW